MVPADDTTTNIFDEAASLPPDYESWTTGDLEFECRRRDVAWAITPKDAVVEHQRRKIMTEVLRLTEVR